MNQDHKLIQNHFTKHKVWLKKVAYNLTKDHTEAVDLVSNLQVRLLESDQDQINKIKFKSELNNNYLFKMMRSQFLNETRTTPWFQSYDSDIHDIEDPQYDYLSDELAFDREECVYWFFNVSSSREDVILFRRYVEEDLSLQQLSDETGINKSKIWSTFDKLKKEIHTVYNDEFKLKNY